jgi:Oxidoreductase FAD-binding domain
MANRVLPRSEPPYHGVGQPQPDQRLIVRATIGGVDVQRPYTLTSSMAERRYYEITVQREPHGIMSNWLFDNMGLGSAVSILPPSGTCFFELHETRPLVCLRHHPGPWHLSLSGRKRCQTPGARGLFGVDPQRDGLR